MCGISGIILKAKKDVNLAEKIISMSDAMQHRGPDGEGFLLVAENAVPVFHKLKQEYTRSDLPYIPKKFIGDQGQDNFLAFGHRRLSIIDLSETGHQPMCSPDSKLWITFNGEIYNYIELRKELKTLGHVFVSESDTEVVLSAYKEWGFSCVEKFNGMWAFCIYDAANKLCFASRDRLGVKPFYYVNHPSLFAFASEQKGFIKAGILKPQINPAALHDYLINGLLESSSDNFFAGVTELWPGNSLVFDLKNKELSLRPYYHLSNHINLQNDGLSEKELIEKISSSLENSVRLRLRSDVEIGTCLSGGIDSSALAAIISEMTGRPLNCFTAVFRNQPFNEEHFADLLAKKIQGRHFKTEPLLEGFLKDVDQLIYSQDVPIWDTSTYAQYKVMELAKEHHIKVVLDGQGADELFGGYHHHFVAMWNNLLSNRQPLKAFKEISASKKTINDPFSFFLKQRLKNRKNFAAKDLFYLFTPDFINAGPVKNPTAYFDNVNNQLINDIYETRLKSFLKCEDRCGMWHSVESRTPFSDDIELISLMFSFNGNKKIKQGVSKHLLREAVKDKLPEQIYRRYDKKGFETPMQQWMQQLRPQMLSEIKSAGFDFVDQNKLLKSDPNNSSHNKALFKLFVLSRWQQLFRA